MIQWYINSINNPRGATLGLFFCYNYNKIKIYNRRIKYILFSSIDSNVIYTKYILKGGDCMDNELMDTLYPSRMLTGPLTEDAIIKEINSDGINPAVRKDLLYRLLALRYNNFNMA